METDTLTLSWLSPAPTRAKMLSSTGIFATAAGTKQPTCEMTQPAQVEGKTQNIFGSPTQASLSLARPNAPAP
jgi:hypothetical protein